MPSCREIVARNYIVMAVTYELAIISLSLFVVIGTLMHFKMSAARHAMKPGCARHAPSGAIALCLLGVMRCHANESRRKRRRRPESEIGAAVTKYSDIVDIKHRAHAAVSILDGNRWHLHGQLRVR